MRESVTQRSRVVFVINSIGTGGAERALDKILRSPRASSHEIHLVLLDREPEARTMPDVAERHCLEAKGSLLRSIIRLDRLVGQLKPDLLVSLLVRANAAAAVAGPRHGVPTIVCERMHLSSHLAGRYSGARLALLRSLPRLLYPRVDRVLAVSDGVRDDLRQAFGLSEQLVETIPNGYDIAAIEAAGARSPTIALPPEYIVAVGRLVEAKRFDLLIDAYAAADPPLPLLILGTGPEAARLEAQAERLSLGGRVRLHGFVDDPFPIVARARFLVSASRNEGFPNAIAEAMALGRAIVSTDCPSGPAELLGASAGAPGEVVEAPYGLIVPDGDALALERAIRRMLDPSVRERLGAAARERIEAFRIEAINARYWALFESLLNGP